MSKMKKPFSAESPTSEILFDAPKHVAVIMDGNGRWAKKRGKSRIMGHRSAVKVVKALVEESYKYGVQTLSLFAFSTENWSRPEVEVNSLMLLCQHAISDEIDSLHERRVRVKFTGDLTRLPKKLQKMINHAEDLTSQNDAMTLQICLNYGGRWDILEATKSLMQKVLAGEISQEQIDNLDQDIFSSHMQALGSDVDLLIRTSGEGRVSNFMLWQIAYAELYFSKVLFPDFNKEQVALAFDYYASRQRRFGGLKEDEQEYGQETEDLARMD